MDQTHLHLMITHLPIFGSVLGAIVLVHGIWTKSNETKEAAYYLFIISAVGAGISYLTGEVAEETVEDIQGVAKNAIDAHEDFAVFALVSLIILGIAAVAGLFLLLKKSPLSQTAALIILFVSVISFGMVARTGYLGGQIRHTEINVDNAQQTQGGENEEEDDD